MKPSEPPNSAGLPSQTTVPPAAALPTPGNTTSLLTQQRASIHHPEAFQQAVPAHQPSNETVPGAEPFPAAAVALQTTLDSLNAKIVNKTAPVSKSDLQTLQSQFATMINAHPVLGQPPFRPEPMPPPVPVQPQQQQQIPQQPAKESPWTVLQQMAQQEGWKDDQKVGQNQPEAKPQTRGQSQQRRAATTAMQQQQQPEYQQPGFTGRVPAPPRQNTDYSRGWQGQEASTIPQYGGVTSAAFVEQPRTSFLPAQQQQVASGSYYNHPVIQPSSIAGAGSFQQQQQQQNQATAVDIQRDVQELMSLLPLLDAGSVNPQLRSAVQSFVESAVPVVQQQQQQQQPLSTSSVLPVQSTQQQQQVQVGGGAHVNQPPTAPEATVQELQRVLAAILDEEQRKQ